MRRIRRSLRRDGRTGARSARPSRRRLPGGTAGGGGGGTRGRRARISVVGGPRAEVGRTVGDRLVRPCRRRVRRGVAVRTIDVRASTRPAGTGLVVRPVLAGVGIFLRIDRPVRAARCAVPRGAAPARLERLLVCALVRGRPGRCRLLGRPPVRRSATTAARAGCRILGAGGAARRFRSRGRAAAGLGSGPRWSPARSRTGRAPAVRPTRGAGSPGICSPRLAGIGTGRRVRVGVGRGARSTRRRTRARTPGATRPGQLVIGRLDRQEFRQGGLAGRIGMVELGEAPMGTPDLVLGRTRREAQRSPRIRVRCHRPKNALPRPIASARARVVTQLRQSASTRSGPGRPQPRISSPSGARSKSGTASALTRPWGSSSVGRW